MQELLTLPEAAKASPGSPSSTSVWRWARKGLRAKNGERIHLEHVRVGRYIFVRPEALSAFFERLAQADIEGLTREQVPRTPTRPTRRVDRDRNAAIAQARRELED